MKGQSITQKRSGSHESDKRNLVNLDLYNNEIIVMEGQLRKVADKHPRAKELPKRIEELRQRLITEKENLQRFRKNYIPEEMFLATNEITEKENEDPANNESFFEHLKSFENNFKNTRQEVTEFVNKWL